MVNSDWSREYFERGYPQRWALAAPSPSVRSEVSGLCRLLRLAPSARVLDIGCGHGRHAIALAERGPQVFGLDAATALLARARALATELHMPVRWIRGDMRALPFRSASAGAAIILDAFGFFETERISISGALESGVYERRQRPFDEEDMRVALEHAGFAVMGIFADPGGAPFHRTASPAIWVVGQR